MKNSPMLVSMKGAVAWFLFTGVLMPLTPRIPLPPVEYFVDDTGIGTGCSQTAPCLLSVALAKPDVEFSIYLAAGDYTGAGPEVVKLDKNINLFGGWDGSTSYPPVRDPEVNLSTIDGQNIRRGITIKWTGGNPLHPIVEGLSIANGNSTGLTDACSGGSGPGEGCGGGIFIHSASPIIRGNRIHHNIAVNSPVATHGYGGGIFAFSCDGSQIYENKIYSNRANPGGSGSGAGIFINDSDSTLQIHHNDFYLNISASSSQLGWGNAIATMNNEQGAIFQNTFHENGAAGYQVHGSVLFEFIGQTRFENNIVRDNFSDCAIYTERTSGEIKNNRVMFNSGTDGLCITYGHENPDCSSDDVMEISNNFIAGNGSREIYSWGSDTNPACLNIYHNTLDGDQTGIYLTSYFTVNIVNNIISNQSIIGINDDSLYSTPLVDHTLFYNNSGGNGLAGSNSIEGDPKYIAADQGIFHIWCDSAAYNAAARGLVTLDIDGQSRPLLGASDIGADECAAMFFLPLIKHN
jgi:hypothetical protein